MCKATDKECSSQNTWKKADCKYAQVNDNYMHTYLHLFYLLLFLIVKLKIKQRR